MDADKVRALLLSLDAGAIGLDEAVHALSASPLGDFATVDTQRALRTGIPEVVYGEGKTVEQIAAILDRLAEAGQDALVTRLCASKAVELPGDYHDVARVLVRRMKPWKDLGAGEIGVLCAGTSDIPVAEEAAVVAEALGNRVRRITDVGVAGLHRLLRHEAALRECRVLVVVAGMEGALPSVVAGLTDKPVLAVPTSVGYGASFGGVSALLAMLNSCAAGVCVVNIDNGFGAAYQATQINRLGLPS